MLKIIKTRPEDNNQNTYKKDIFSLTYGSEAVILAEVELTSYRVDNHDERRNGEAIHL